MDDHETVRLGLRLLLSRAPDLELVASTSTVAELMPIVESLDLVVLDLRLSDGSTLEQNVAALREHNANVLAFTGADSVVDVRAASRSGVLGVVRKSDASDVILEAIRTAGEGATVASTEWAAALDADPLIAVAGLSPKEQEVLALYAAGDKSVSVANRAGLSTSTVAEYVRRIRHKYAMAGRPAHTKIDLYKRAVEDGILPLPET